ncbi:MAG: DUF4397 domain-containing protein [Gemmatimonadota bacterium]
MRFRALIPCLALAALGTTACEDGDDIGGPGTTTQANVRFINTIADARGNLALTANGVMVGSAQAFANANAQCVRVNPGTVNLAFGTANTGGTGIASSFGTASANFRAGEEFTLIATGSTIDPRLIVLDNRPQTVATAGNANLRFVNATGNANVNLFATASGLPVTDPGFAQASGTASGFSAFPIGNSTLTFRNVGSTENLFTTRGTFTSRGNFTVVLLPGAGGTGFQTLVLRDC